MPKIYCTCGVLISTQAYEGYSISTSKRLYASNQGPINYSIDQNDEYYPHCNCRVKYFNCANCRMICGYYLVSVCSQCKPRHDGHYWLYTNCYEEKEYYSNAPKKEPRQQSKRKEVAPNRKVEEEKPREKEKLKPQQKFKWKGDLYEYLSYHGISDLTIQILKSEEIKTIEEVYNSSNEDLKLIGIKMGEILRIRKLLE